MQNLHLFFVHVKAKKNLCLQNKKKLAFFLNSKQRRGGIFAFLWENVSMIRTWISLVPEHSPDKNDKNQGCQNNSNKRKRDGTYSPIAGEFEVFFRNFHAPYMVGIWQGAIWTIIATGFVNVIQNLKKGPKYINIVNLVFRTYFTVKKKWLWDKFQMSFFESVKMCEWHKTRFFNNTILSIRLYPIPMNTKKYEYKPVFSIVEKWKKESTFMIYKMWKISIFLL